MKGPHIKLIALLFVFIWPAAAFGEGRDVYETSYASIRYESREDFSALERNLKGGLSMLFKPHGPGSDYLAGVVDGLFEKVEFYLDMYPKGLKIKIEVYGDARAMEKAYRGLGLKGAVPRAFYNSRNKTVYVNAEDVSYGILGHEFAHSVICAYFNNSVPSKTQEILAHYVDEQIGQ